MRARRVPLVRDAVTAAALSGGLGAWFTGYAGILDANAEARAVLDLRRLGASVSGLRLWAVAISLTSGPFAIGTISKPVILELD